MLGEKCSFVRSLEVQLAVAGVDFVEEAEILGNRFGKFAIGGGYERDAAADSFFLPEKIKNLPADREDGRGRVGSWRRAGA